MGPPPGRPSDFQPEDRRLPARAVRPAMAAAPMIPKDGAFRSPAHDYWFNGDGPYPGATRPAGELSKDAVINWAKTEAARCAIENYDIVADLVKRGGTEAAVKWIAALPDYKRDLAGTLGSAVHTLAEQIQRGGEVTVGEIERPYIEAYQAFIEAEKPTSVKVERMVFNPTVGYAGTLDMLCRLGGTPTLLDIKTGASAGGVWPETTLQLAAYRYAEFVGVPGDRKKYSMPKIDRVAVLWIRPDKVAQGYRLIDYPIEDIDFDAFKAALEIHLWRKARFNRRRS